MLMLELCYHIFHGESATLSILKVKGYSLHDCNNVFLLWNFCTHLIALHQPVGHKFHLLTCCLSVLLFQDFILEIHCYKIYHLVQSQCNCSTFFFQLIYTCQVCRQQKERDKLDDLVYNYCDICTMLMLTFFSQEF